MHKCRAAGLQASIWKTDYYIIGQQRVTHGSSVPFLESVAGARYEDGHDNLEPIAQVSCGIAAGVVADTWLLFILLLGISQKHGVSYILRSSAAGIA